MPWWTAWLQICIAARHSINKVASTCHITCFKTRQTSTYRSDLRLSQRVETSKGFVFNQAMHPPRCERQVKKLILRSRGMQKHCSKCKSFSTIITHEVVGLWALFRSWSLRIGRVLQWGIECRARGRVKRLRQCTDGKLIEIMVYFEFYQSTYLFTIWKFHV